MISFSNFGTVRGWGCARVLNHAIWETAVVCSSSSGFYRGLGREKKRGEGRGGGGGLFFLLS